MSARLEAALAELAAAIRDEIRDAPEPEIPAALLSVDQAAAALGIGRTALYGLFAAGLVSISVGRRRLVSRAAIDDYIAARSAEP